MHNQRFYIGRQYPSCEGHYLWPGQSRKAVSGKTPEAKLPGGGQPPQGPSLPAPLPLPSCLLGCHPYPIRLLLRGVGLDPGERGGNASFLNDRETPTPSEPGVAFSERWGRASVLGTPGSGKRAVPSKTPRREGKDGQPRPEKVSKGSRETVMLLKGPKGALGVHGRCQMS
jgi:hypothetical protein